MGPQSRRALEITEDSSCSSSAVVSKVKLLIPYSFLFFSFGWPIPAASGNHALDFGSKLPKRLASYILLYICIRFAGGTKLHYIRLCIYSSRPLPLHIHLVRPSLCFSLSVRRQNSTFFFLPVQLHTLYYILICIQLAAIPSSRLNRQIVKRSCSSSGPPRRRCNQSANASSITRTRLQSCSRKSKEGAEKVEPSLQALRTRHFNEKRMIDQLVGRALLRA